MRVFTWGVRGTLSPSLQRNRIKSIFSTVGILIESIFDMKKRTAFIGGILSLIPFGQPLIIKTGVVLSTASYMASFPENLYAKYIMRTFFIARRF